MSQAPFTIGNVSGAVYRSGDVSRAKALASFFAGPAEPVERVAYMWWLDETANIMKMRNAANNGWLNVFMWNGIALIPLLYDVDETSIQIGVDGLEVVQSWVQGLIDASVGGLIAIKVFTTSGPWTKSAGTRSVVIDGQGAGGKGGGSSNTDDRIGGGGGGGAYFRKRLDVTAIASAAIIIGAPGTSGDGTTDGGNGGDVVWSDGTNTLTAGGGQGGAAAGVGSAAPGGVATGGDINIPGGRGGFGGVDAVSADGRGGDSQFGQGSPHAPRQVLSLSGEGYGAGGAGGHGGADAIEGGDGAPGILIVYEYK